MFTQSPGAVVALWPLWLAAYLVAGGVVLRLTFSYPHLRQAARDVLAEWAGNPAHGMMFLRVWIVLTWPVELVRLIRDVRAGYKRDR